MGEFGWLWVRERDKAVFVEIGLWMRVVKACVVYGVVFVCMRSVSVFVFIFFFVSVV